MKTFLISSLLLSTLAYLQFNASQHYVLGLADKEVPKIVVADKIERQVVHMDVAPAIEYEAPAVEPIVFWGESKRIKTELDSVLIVAHGYNPCGCQPNYPPIRIVEPLEELEVEESLFAEPIYVDPYIFETKVYPNPSQFQSTVEINIEQDDQFEIEMFDLNGRKVRAIHAGELYAGVNRFTVDLQDLESGMYLIMVRSAHQQETLKLQKLN